VKKALYALAGVFAFFASNVCYGSEISGYGNKCMDVRGAGTANGTAVQMWGCVGVPNQQWRINNGKIVGYGNKCLDVRGAGTANGTVVQMWDCVDVPNQQWSIK
jgi:hypothetical protein